MPLILGDTAITVSSILDDVATFFTQLWSWVAEAATAIVSSPLILIFLVGIPIAGLALGWIRSLISRR